MHAVHIFGRLEIMPSGIKANAFPHQGNMFLRVFGRLPVEKEWTAVQQAIVAAPDARQAALEDLFWALLNSKEFFFNH